MEAYKNLKDDWKKSKSNLPETEEAINTIQNKLNQLKKGQKTTNVILGITVIIITAYLIYVLQFGINRLNGGLLIMVATLMIRLSIEIRDKRKISNLNPLLTIDEFTDKLHKYYKQRLVLHKVITPILFILYIIGFTLLLPTFKTIFSEGFYNYLLFSGFGSLLVIAIIIIKQAHKELQELKALY